MAESSTDWLSYQILQEDCINVLKTCTSIDPVVPIKELT